MLSGQYVHRNICGKRSTNEGTRASTTTLNGTNLVRGRVMIFVGLKDPREQPGIVAEVRVAEQDAALRGARSEYHCRHDGGWRWHADVHGVAIGTCSGNGWDRRASSSTRPVGEQGREGWLICANAQGISSGKIHRAGCRGSTHRCGNGDVPPPCWSAPTSMGSESLVARARVRFVGMMEGWVRLVVAKRCGSVGTTRAERC